MSKQSQKGLGRLIYMEWIIPIMDYYCSIRKNEVVYEIAAPIIIACICSSIYFFNGNFLIALDKLAELLPTAISILIGFTVMLITLLLTSSGENVDCLKCIETEKILYKKPVTLYQGLHIQFSHSLFSEVFLLLLIFLYLFLKGLDIKKEFNVVFLFFEIYLTLNILLSILRGIANLYFSFYNTKSQAKGNNVLQKGVEFMSFSIRLTAEEKALAESYAKLHSMSVGEAFKRALFTQIEDEYDIAIAEEAHREYVANPKTYTHEEVRELLDL